MVVILLEFRKFMKFDLLKEMSHFTILARSLGSLGFLRIGATKGPSHEKCLRASSTAGRVSPNPRTKAIHKSLSGYGKRRLVAGVIKQ
jgi:hypothetical protein